MNIINSKYLQDKNAGNLGDILKHFYLLELFQQITKTYAQDSVAYIDSHAGAGLYKLDDARKTKIGQYKSLVCSDMGKWRLFDTLNPVKNYQYFGSWVLAAKYLDRVEAQCRILIYEHDAHAVNRIEEVLSTHNFRTPIQLTPRKISPTEIKEAISGLKKEGFRTIALLVDPFFKDGKEDSVWVEMLKENEEGLFVIMFDFARASGKDPNGNLKCRWHADQHLISYKTHAINGYALFGNRNAYKALK